MTLKQIIEKTMPSQDYFRCRYYCEWSEFTLQVERYGGPDNAKYDPIGIGGIKEWVENICKEIEDNGKTGQYPGLVKNALAELKTNWHKGMSFGNADYPGFTFSAAIDEAKESIKSYSNDI